MISDLIWSFLSICDSSRMINLQNLCFCEHVSHSLCKIHGGQEGDKMYFLNWGSVQVMLGDQAMGSWIDAA